ncbi:hypothetical protein [Kiloniella sp. b19]|uniref:flagellar biosynthesis protein FlhF n=1 Tax=Kiloniella sp. GXU_MW_B19 TaxID=3141326 RepID=UPI0031D69998
MRIKHYICQNLPEAMSLIRDDLGDEAIILSSEEMSDGRVQVTAGLDDDLFVEEQAIQDDFPSDDIDFLDRITDILEFHRLPQPLINRIVGDASGVPAHEWHLALAGAFDNKLSFSSLPSGPIQKPLMLVGPPGDGKTATIAKICARQLIQGQKTAVITLDGSKTGGLEQISGFCHRLNAKLDMADTPNELRAAMARRSADELVLIDCFGVNPFDQAALQDIEEFTQTVDPEIAVVLSAGGDVFETADKAEAFAAINARHFIPTKLDMTHRYGGILTAALTGKLALMAAGTSPQIADGLTPINPVSLARLLLPGEEDPQSDLSQEANQAHVPSPFATGTRR